MLCPSVWEPCSRVEEGLIGSVRQGGRSSASSDNEGLRDALTSQRRHAASGRLR
jgi:hypothetical protein